MFQALNYREPDPLVLIVEQRRDLRQQATTAEGQGGTRSAGTDLGRVVLASLPQDFGVFSFAVSRQQGHGPDAIGERARAKGRVHMSDPGPITALE